MGFPARIAIAKGERLGERFGSSVEIGLRLSFSGNIKNFRYPCYVNRSQPLKMSMVGWHSSLAALQITFTKQAVTGCVCVCVCVPRGGGVWTLKDWKLVKAVCLWVCLCVCVVWGGGECLKTIQRRCCNSKILTIAAQIMNHRPIHNFIRHNCPSTLRGTSPHISELFC